MRSVAMIPDNCHESSVSLLIPVAQINTGMKRTVITAKIMRVAKIGDIAFVFFNNISILLVYGLNAEDTKLPPPTLVKVTV